MVFMRVLLGLHKWVEGFSRLMGISPICRCVFFLFTGFRNLDKALRRLLGCSTNLISAASSLVSSLEGGASAISISKP